MSREERYRITGEIFTPLPLAEKLLSSLPKEVWKENKTFLDPSCGTGNLLIAVFWRKIKNGYNPLESIQSIYGVDIISENIRDCRIRLLKLISIFENVTDDHIKAVLTNIVFVSKGSLEYDFSFLPETDIEGWKEWEKEQELPIREALVESKQNNIFS